MDLTEPYKADLEHNDSSYGAHILYALETISQQLYELALLTVLASCNPGHRRDPHAGKSDGLRVSSEGDGD